MAQSPCDFAVGGFAMSDLVFGFSMAAVSDWATGTQLDNNSSRTCFIPNSDTDFNTNANLADSDSGRHHEQ
jgi:hypothetical protein